MKSKAKKPNVLTLLKKGYNERDPRRLEFYATIENDLAEGIEIKGRLTRENLIEVIGHLRAVDQQRINEYNWLEMELLGLVTKSMARRGFQKWITAAKKEEAK